MWFKTVLTLFLLPIVMIFSYVAFSFLLLGVFSPQAHLEGSKTILLYSDEAHTEIMIDIKDLNHSFLTELSAVLPQNPSGFLGISYGDEKFMMETPTWNDLKFTNAAKALFGANPALIRVNYYARLNPNMVLKIPIQADALEKLQTSLKQSFLYHKGQLIPCAMPYPQRNSFYFKAKEPYHLFHTCNNWSGNRLRDAGFALPYLTPFAIQVTYPLTFKPQVKERP